MLPVGSRLSNWQIGMKVYGEMFHMTLDIMGLVPIGGEIFDIINGETYYLEGDKTNAYLNWASAVPIAGYAAATAKLIKAGAVVVAVKGANDL